jgi:prephenate dehydrogenase
VRWNKVTIVGVGLLGGSLGLALRQRGLAGCVYGLVRRTASIDECARLGVVDQASCDAVRAAEGAELVVLCTPLSRMRATLEPMLPALKPGTVVTDVGSVKVPVVQELEPLVASAGAHFIGSHPMAGSEKTGPGAARADLFERAVCVVTPTPQSASSAVEQVEALWQGLGGRVLRLSAQRHDELVGRASHLPHVVAAGLAKYVLSPDAPPEQALVCASGFRDVTRIAASSAEMWRDIALANAVNLAEALTVFIRELEQFRQALLQGNQAAVEQFFQTARQRRTAWANPAGGG